MSAVQDQVREVLREFLAPAQEWLTTAEAARYLSCSTQFLEIARHKGDGPPYSKNIRIRYSRTDLDKWMRDQTDAA